MKFKIAFALYLIVCLFYGVVPIFGSISLRHIFTLIMLVWCVLEKGVVFDNFLKWFSVFLFFSALGEITTGYEVAFFNTLFGTYLAAFVMYFSTKVVIKKYDAGVWVMLVILAVAVLNAVVTIGQFYGNSIANNLPQVLRIDLGEEMVDFYERHTDFHGKYVGGLLGVVLSGYFFSATSILALFNTKGRIEIYNWLLFAFLFFALFLVQERAGLLSAIVGFLLYMLVNGSQDRSTIIRYVVFFVIAIAFVSYYGVRMVNYGEMRYFTVGFEDSRFKLAVNGWNYFWDHPFGGYKAYLAADNRAPHLVFVLVFLYGGLFGGLIALGIFFTQIGKVLRILYEFFTKKKHSIMLNMYGIVFLVYTINCLFHNSSLFTGNPMFFLLWGAVVALHEMEIDTSRLHFNRQY